MKKWTLCVLLLLVSQPIAANDNNSEGAEKNMNEISAAQLLEQADSIFQSREYAKALDSYREVAERAHDEFNKSVEIEALSQMARMNLLLNKKDEGRAFLDQAAQKISEEDSLGYSRYLGVLGRYQWKDDDLKSARETFDRMYVYCLNKNLFSRAVDAAHMIAIVAESPDDQIEWSRRGIEAAEKGGVEKWLGPLWNNLAVTYYDLEKYDSALECFTKAREYHWRYSDEYAKLFADYHIGMTYRRLGQYEEALKWLRPVLAWAQRLENHGAIGQTLEDLGEIDIAKGNIEEGIKKLKQARDEYKLEKYDQTWPQIWQCINERIDSLEHNP